MKGTEVLTFGAVGMINLYTQQGEDADDVHAIPYACAVLLIGGLVQFYSFTDSWSVTNSLRVGHRLATRLDSTRESILALRCNFWCLQGT